MTDQRIQSVLESLLFVWGEPLSARAVAELFDLSESETARLLRELADDYRARGSGLQIREMDGCFQLCTATENDDYIRKFCTPVKEKRLSQAALEVLAIIAYKQPVTKPQIDGIRGIKSDRVLEGLLRRGLIEEKGRSEAIGRPVLYGTTLEFLAQFGFESLSDLPEIEDVDSLLLSDEEAEQSEDQLTIPLDQ